MDALANHTNAKLSTGEIVDAQWRTLYWIGAVVGLTTVALNKRILYERDKRKKEPMGGAQALTAARDIRP